MAAEIPVASKLWKKGYDQSLKVLKDCFRCAEERFLGVKDQPDGQSEIPTGVHLFGKCPQ